MHDHRLPAKQVSYNHVPPDQPNRLQRCRHLPYHPPKSNCRLGLRSCRCQHGQTTCVLLLQRIGYRDRPKYSPWVIRKVRMSLRPRLGHRPWPKSYPRHKHAPHKQSRVRYLHPDVVESRQQYYYIPQPWRLSPS